ncbi:MAG TPA: hypothetical protein PLA13_01905 [Microbacteriaceae bacterium]|jgi:hypothetical protein|nr:hypothetical protein [Microbacteriaceae bacterium]HQZ47654.1 hypothetical protein [Microbacteriaceae bacterium]
MSDEIERETGGDAACWLDRVCTECGAFVEGEPGPEGLVCWRCGRLQSPED